ncbi:hypothetical protein BDQ12DRAFT_573117, partial [Crucibulum laeve]
LGFLCQNQKLDLLDYKHYEEIRDNLLRSSIGRAALMRGGIIWRLAYNVVSLKEVTKGPSPTASQFGVIVGVDAGWNLIDDGISPSAEDIICGVYKRPTGNGQQTADYSWWP